MSCHVLGDMSVLTQVHVYWRQGEVLSIYSYTHYLSTLPLSTHLHNLYASSSCIVHTSESASEYSLHSTPSLWLWRQNLEGGLYNTCPTQEPQEESSVQHVSGQKCRACMEEARWVGVNYLNWMFESIKSNFRLASSGLYPVPVYWSHDSLELHESCQISIQIFWQWCNMNKGFCKIRIIVGWCGYAKVRVSHIIQPLLPLV